MVHACIQQSGCGKSFIWAVRPPIGFDINSEFREDEWLPKGFVERVQESGKGLVVRDFGVSESLRVELGAGITESGGAYSGMADGGGAVLQLQVVGGRGWDMREGCKREEL
ncbi:hypothetical protein LR48_Vigan728s001700 [Vigna angularis]|uniref:Uncharacterized protein n=1 Tax=Phaseolus angularis TaxID=3914 RepID=A0A0L9THH2_PHAAN|nr:uncharacterized protein HKW66_Vig0023600 [Vigna angularis]KOM29594.1 hypothetical protein LR48_Vigan728s001700 [Vigna angularis]